MPKALPKPWFLDVVGRVDNTIVSTLDSVSPPGSPSDCNFFQRKNGLNFGLLCSAAVTRELKPKTGARPGGLLTLSVAGLGGGPATSRSRTWSPGALFDPLPADLLPPTFSRMIRMK